MSKRRQEGLPEQVEGFLEEAMKDIKLEPGHKRGHKRTAFQKSHSPFL